MNGYSNYLIQLLICSGIFYLYYILALRNQCYHLWNRFYLLSAVVVSLFTPLLSFSLFHFSDETKTSSFQLLQVVQNAHEYMDEVPFLHRGHASGTSLYFLFYFIISSILFFRLLISLARLFINIKKSQAQQMGKARLIQSKVSGSPFSFFQYIFWNEQLDLHSGTGRQILNHELVHVREKHTIDNLFIQCVLVVFWMNPFFWFIGKELKLVHEFRADERSLAPHDLSAFASMIIQSTSAVNSYQVVHHFFQTSLKRRINMITKHKSSRLGFPGRLLAWPVFALTFLAFTLKTKEVIKSGIPFEKNITVAIDAGHGKMENGSFNGARQGNEVEDEIVFAIAKKVESLNEDSKIKILLTRTTPSIMELNQRIEMARVNHADLFISIHINANLEHADSSGMEIYVSGKGTAYQKESEVFGSLLQRELNTLYTTKPFLKSSSGVMVLDKNTCPAVLIECGYLTNENDLKFIAQDQNQIQVARGILAAIHKYATY